MPFQIHEKKFSRKQITLLFAFIWLVAIIMSFEDVTMHDAYQIISACYVRSPVDYLMRMIEQLSLIIACAGFCYYFSYFRARCFEVFTATSSPSPSRESNILLDFNERPNSRNSNEIHVEHNMLSVLPKVKVTKVRSLDKGCEAFFLRRLMKYTYILMLLFLVTMLSMFIMFNWFGQTLKSFFVDFYDLDILVYDLIQHLIMLAYAIHKPILYLQIYGKEFKHLRFLRCVLGKTLSKTIWKTGNDSNMCNERSQEFQMESTTIQ